MMPNREDLIQYTEWLKALIIEQEDADPIYDVSEKVDQYLESLDTLDPPEGDPYWIAGRDSRGSIRLNRGRGSHIANPENTPAEIQDWYNRATKKRWRKAYGAALDLLDQEEGR